MKIMSVEQFTAHRVVTDEKDYAIYTRYSPNSWSVQMGESDEMVYYCDKLESEFQRFITSNKPTST